MTETNKSNTLELFASDGATFTLPAKGKKYVASDGWKNDPKSYEEAITWANKGNNVALFTGSNSAGIVALDIDHSAPEKIALLGDFANTAKVIRSNAPDRAKLLYKVSGQLPPKTRWNSDGGEHPHIEMLCNSQACIYGMAEGGFYHLVDESYGIKEVTPNDLNSIWFTLTGELLYKTEVKNTGNRQDDKFKEDVRNAWKILEVFTFHNFVKDGTRKEGINTRIKGHAGLVVNEEKGWYQHSSGKGGDVFDAWAFCTNRSTDTDFADIINEMAKEKGIERPKRKLNLESKKPIWSDYLKVLTDNGYSFRMNEMIDSIEVNNIPMSDPLESEFVCLLNEHSMNNRHLMRDAFVKHARDNSYHPIKNYFESLAWDGQDHIAKLASFFTDDHDEIVYADGSKRSVFHAWLYRWTISAVGKVYDCLKYQSPMLILNGAQNAGKNTFVKWLCFDDRFYITSQVDPHNKDHEKYLVSYFIWSVPETGSTFRKTDREAFKDFLTKDKVVVRLAYGHHDTIKPPVASFIGSVNPEPGLLNDPTGYRRFLPVTLKSIDWSYESVDKHQVWAQAYHLFKSGEKHTLAPEESKIHNTITAALEFEDPMRDYLNRYFEIDKNKQEWFTLSADLIHQVRLMAEISGSDKAIAMRIAAELKKLGIERERRFYDKKQQWGYSGIKKCNSINRP